MKNLVRMLTIWMLILFPVSLGFCNEPLKIVRNYTNAYVADLNVALRLSQETKQNVLVVFSAEWCGYCSSLKKDLIDLKGLENKILCIIDVDDNKKLARQYKAKTLPTSVLINSDEQELSRLSGYEKISYQKWLQSF